MYTVRDLYSWTYIAVHMNTLTKDGYEHMYTNRVKNICIYIWYARMH